MELNDQPWKEDLVDEMDKIVCHPLSGLDLNLSTLSQLKDQTDGLFELYLSDPWPSLDVFHELKKVQNIGGIRLSWITGNTVNYKEGLSIIANLPSVTYFWAECIYLKALQIPIAFPKLKLLYLNGSPLNQVPEGIENCKELLYCAVSGDFSQENEAFEKFNGCDKLRCLELDNTKITTFPEALSHHPTLEELDLVYNRISVIPDSISNMKSLKKLFLSNNLIQQIPESFIYFKCLEYLGLGHCRISEIPEFICHIKPLKHISLHNNQIRDISWDIRKLRNLPNLEVMNLMDNPLSDECKSRIRQEFPIEQIPKILLDKDDEKVWWDSQIN